MDPRPLIDPRDIVMRIARPTGGGPCTISMVHRPSGVKVRGGANTPEERDRLRKKLQRKLQERTEAP